MKNRQPRKMGRKTLRDETVQANVINLSWLTIDRALNSPDITIQEKRVIALEIVKKSCPKEINLKGEGIASTVYNLIGELQRDFQASRRTPLVLDTGDGVHKG